jgi:hypothetical protein
MLVLVILSLGIIFTGLIRNPYIQTYTARIVAIHLSEYLQSSVKIDKLYISTFFTLRAQGVEINDLQNKPLIHFKNLYLAADINKAFDFGLAFRTVEIDSAMVFIRQYRRQKELNITNILNRFKFSATTDTLNKTPFELSINKLTLKNARFSYQVEEKIAEGSFGVNYSDFDIFDIQAEIKDIQILNDSILAKIESLSAIEKCGFQLNHLEGKLTISGKGASLLEAMLETPSSKAELDLNFDYENWADYLEFIEKVNLRGEVFASDFNLNDIAYFAPEMEGMDNQLEIFGTFSGPISNLRARNLELAMGEKTQFKGSAQLTGLPNIYETFISLRVQEFKTTISDIQKINLPQGKKITQIPEIVSSIGTVRIKGNFTGFYNDFVSNASFQTNIGKLTTDIQFSSNAQSKITQYRGDFKGRQFNLGRFLEQDNVYGKVDFDLKVKGEGLDIENLRADVSGKIGTFVFKQNKLEDISINGMFQERQFTGNISVKDELISADFRGHISFDSIVPVFDFNLKLANTHLAWLGLMAVDSSTVISSDIQLNFSGNTIDNIRGNVQLDNTELIYKNEIYKMRRMRIQTQSDLNNRRTILLNSDFVDGEAEGDFLLTELKTTSNIFLNYYLPKLFNAEIQSTDLETKNLAWDIRFKDFSKIMPLFSKNLKLSKNGKWKGKFDVDRNNIESQIELESAVYQGIVIRKFKLDILSDTKSLRADLSTEEIVFKEEQPTDTLRLGIDNLHFSAKALQDNVDFVLNWHNNFKDIKNEADIVGFIDLSQIPSFDLKFSKANLIVNDTIWHIYDDNKLRVVDNQLFFEKFGFFSGSQKIEWSGALDRKNEKALIAKFNHFDVSNFDILTNYKGIDLDGFIDGEIQFLNLLENADFLANLQVNQFKVNKEMIGNVFLNSKRNLDKSIFINAEIVKQISENQNIKPLILEGLYFPDKQNNALDFSLILDQLPIQVASPFLYKWVDQFNGTASGNVLITGSTSMPNLKGKIRFNEVDFRIIYLNTNYKLSANIDVNNDFFDIRDADFRDEAGNKAMVYGGLLHNHLKNFGVDLSIWPENFMILNTRKGMNSLFYGKAFAKGTVDISGPFDAIHMNINLEANRGSEIVIPINLAADVSKNEFINFINRKDSTSEKKVKKAIQELSSFSLNMDLSLNPNAKVEIILPEDLGNIQGVGYGDLNLNLNRAGVFTMAGDYQVNKGTFLFTIKNVYKKRFDLVDGGTISWTGDPYSGELNMKAVYHVKTSLNTLGASQDTSFRTRIPVDCVIGLKDKILNPTVKFGFEFPNSSEEIRQLVFSQIDTTNEAEMSRQILSLLVLNSFSFSSATGNSSISSGVSGSSLQLVANQLGNWLSQISNDVNVGINYRPGGTITNEEVEVALSTQLFNERVMIDGNFGYQNLANAPNSNTSNIVGDINVEVKITKDGRFRLKAFNRTNTIDLIDNTAPYTQGVGVFYRKEYNVFKDLFIRQRKKKEPEKAKDPEIETATQSQSGS